MRKRVRLTEVTLVNQTFTPRSKRYIYCHGLKKIFTIKFDLIQSSCLQLCHTEEKISFIKVTRNVHCNVLYASVI